MSEWNVNIAPPERFKDGPSELATRRQIDNWINTLPAAATGELSRRLYHALQELAQHRLAPVLRFHFLEQSNGVFINLLRGLEQHVYRGGFPVSEHNQKTSRLLLTLLALRVVNYRLILDDLHQSLFAGGFKRQRIQHIALLRIIEMLGEGFELYRHLDRPAAAGWWQTYHRYYVLAESEGTLDHQLPSIEAQRSTSIASEFKLQQLLQALNPHDLRQHEYHAVKAVIRAYSPKILLQQRGDLHNEDCYCIHLNDDEPMSFFEPERALQHEPSTWLRCVNITAFRQYLTAFLEQDKDELALGGVKLNRHTARVMLDAWRIHQNNHAQREVISQTVRIVHGLSHIARIVAGQQHTLNPGNAAMAAVSPKVVEELPFSAEANEHPDEQDEFEVIIMEQEEFVEAFQADVEGLDIAFHKEKLVDEADMWDTAYINIAQPAPHWVEHYRREHEASIIDAQLMDRSPNGYGLSVQKNAQSQQLQIGDLIGMEIDHDWQLLCIRWIREDGEQLRLGLRCIGFHLHAQMLVVNRRGQPSQPMPVLHLTHQRGVPALVLHNINIHTRDSISFADGEEKVRIQLGELLDSSAVFECYQLERNTLQ